MNEPDSCTNITIDPSHRCWAKPDEETKKKIVLHQDSDLVYITTNAGLLVYCQEIVHSNGKIELSPLSYQQIHQM